MDNEKLRENGSTAHFVLATPDVKCGGEILLFKRPIGGTNEYH